MAHAATFDAYQHFAAARRGTIDDGLAERLPVGDQGLAVHLRSSSALSGFSESGPSSERGAPLVRAIGRMPQRRRGERRASATNRSTDNSSARAVASRSAAASKAGTSTPSERRLWRSILRRWPKAACVTLSSSCGRRAAARAWHRSTSEDLTFGGGTKRRGVDVEQDARLAAPLRQHRQASVALRMRLRQRCVRRPRAGTSGPRYRTRAATARR